MTNEEFIKKCRRVMVIQNLSAVCFDSLIENVDDVRQSKNVALEIARLHREELELVDQINLHIFDENRA